MTRRFTGPKLPSAARRMTWVHSTDGTLTEMNLAVDDEELPLDRCPGGRSGDVSERGVWRKGRRDRRDMKYGVTIYQTVVDHQGKSYEIVVAEDGTLVEKVLVIDDEEIKLSDCPAAVRTALHEHAKGGEIGDITRSTGIGQHTFEAEVKIKDKVYLIEVAESGLLDLQVARGRQRLSEVDGLSGSIARHSARGWLAGYARLPVHVPWCSSPGCRAAC